MSVKLFANLAAKNGTTYDGRKRRRFPITPGGISPNVPYEIIPNGSENCRTGNVSRTDWPQTLVSAGANVPDNKKEID